MVAGRSFAQDWACARDSAVEFSSARECADAAVTPPLLLPDQPFTTGAASVHSSVQLVMLQFAEAGRQKLLAGDYEAALERLQKALALSPDRFLPYIYFYIGQVHRQRGDLAAAHNFLVVAAAWLGHEPDWAPSFASLR